MKVVERRIFKIAAGKWDQINNLEQRFDALEAQWGFPPKRRYRCIAGTHDSDTYIFEREWDSLSAAETAGQKAMADQQWQALMQEGEQVFVSSQAELYSLLE
jgi:hypothetical protein